MSGQTLEEYLKHYNLDETRRKYLLNIKEGKQQDKDLEQYFKNGDREQYSVVSDRYSIYTKKFDPWKRRHTVNLRSYYSSI
jgi:hypothetical protein